MRKLVPPTVTFEDNLIYNIGGNVVEFRFVGPAHTWGDLVAYLPQHKILFAADLAFFHLVPYCHNAYVSKWMESIDKVMKWDVDVIVPGHGPVGGKKDLAESGEYFRFLKTEVKKRYDAKMSPGAAAADIKMGKYDNWMGPERIVDEHRPLVRRIQGHPHAGHRCGGHEAGDPGVQLDQGRRKKICVSDARIRGRGQTLCALSFLCVRSSLSPTGKIFNTEDTEKLRGARRELLRSRRAAGHYFGFTSVQDQRIPAQKDRVRCEFRGPALAAFSLWREPGEETDRRDERPVEPEVGLGFVAIGAASFEAVFFENVAQLRIGDGIDVQNDFFFFSPLFVAHAQVLFGNRLEVRRVAVEQPFHALFDIQNIGHADHQLPAGREQPREFANRLMRIFDVLEAFEASDVLKFGVFVRQHAGQIAAAHFDFRQPENFGIQVAGLHLKTRFGETRGERSFPGGNIEQFPARKWIEDSRDGLMNFQTGDRYRRAVRIRCHGLYFLLRRTFRWARAHCSGRYHDSVAGGRPAILPANPTALVHNTGLKKTPLESSCTLRNGRKIRLTPHGTAHIIHVLKVSFSVIRSQASLERGITMGFPAPALRTKLIRRSVRHTVGFPAFVFLATVLCLSTGIARANDPKPTPENTIHIALGAPVAPQKFSRPLKFFVGDVIDRAGNAQPMLVTSARGGIFVDRLPVDVVREALESSLKTADLLSPDAASADLILNVYLFHFGLAPSMGDLFGKIELAVAVKDPKTGKSQQISAIGTSISHIAVRKKNEMKDLEADFNGALGDAIRNLLRGQALHDAVMSSPASPAPAGN